MTEFLSESVAWGGGGVPVSDPICSPSANGVNHPIYHFLAGEGGLYLLEVIEGEFGVAGLSRDDECTSDPRLGSFLSSCELRLWNDG